MYWHWAVVYHFNSSVEVLRNRVHGLTGRRGWVSQQGMKQWSNPQIIYLRELENIFQDKDENSVKQNVSCSSLGYIYTVYTTISDAFLWYLDNFSRFPASPLWFSALQLCVPYSPTAFTCCCHFIGFWWALSWGFTCRLFHRLPRLVVQLTMYMYMYMCMLYCMCHWKLIFWPLFHFCKCCIHIYMYCIQSSCMLILGRAPVHCCSIGSRPSPLSTFQLHVRGWKQYVHTRPGTETTMIKYMYIHDSEYLPSVRFLLYLLFVHIHQVTMETGVPTWPMSFYQEQPTLRRTARTSTLRAEFSKPGSIGTRTCMWIVYLV